VHDLELMVAGFVPISKETSAALGDPITAHYGREGAEFCHDTMRRLARAFQTEEKVVCIATLICELYPSSSINRSIPVKPVLSAKARCLFVKEVPAGSYLGYGCAFKTSRDSRIATITVGFADGISKLYTKNM